MRGIPADYLWEHSNAAYCILSEQFTTHNWWWDFRLFSVVNYWWAVLHPLSFVKCSRHWEHDRAIPGRISSKPFPFHFLSSQESMDWESRPKLTHKSIMHEDPFQVLFTAQCLHFFLLEEIWSNLKWLLSGFMCGPFLIIPINSKQQSIKRPLPLPCNRTTAKMKHSWDNIRQ